MLDGDFPDREAMMEIAEVNSGKPSLSYVRCPSDYSSRLKQIGLKYFQRDLRFYAHIVLEVRKLLILEDRTSQGWYNTTKPEETAGCGAHNATAKDCQLQHELCLSDHFASISEHLGFICLHGRDKLHLSSLDSRQCAAE
jgi:hypothetical protein